MDMEDDSKITQLFINAVRKKKESGGLGEVEVRAKLSEDEYGRVLKLLHSNKMFVLTEEVFSDELYMACRRRDKKNEQKKILYKDTFMLEGKEIKIIYNTEATLPDGDHGALGGLKVGAACSSQLGLFLEVTKIAGGIAPGAGPHKGS